MSFKGVFANRAVSLLLAIAVLIGTTVVVLHDNKNETVNFKQSEGASNTPLVTVTNINSRSEYLVVDAFAEVKPRWDVDLKSEVNGIVISVNNSAMNGSRVEKDEPLLIVDEAQYRAELADAERLYREAALELERAVHSNHVAKRQLEHVGESPPNDLALQLPQLRIAESSIQAAQAHVDLARQRLRKTVIRAPFNGVVVERYVSPGQLLMAGEPVARLIDDSHYTLAVSINKNDWQLLNHPMDGQKVALYNENDALVGEATVGENGGYLNEDTRHYVIQLHVQSNETSILAGDFVRVRIQGRIEPDALNIPTGALTAEGSIWWVDSQGLLVKGTVDVLLHNDDRVVVRAPEKQDSWQIVSIPLASYLPGQKVQTINSEVR